MGGPVNGIQRVEGTAWATATGPYAGMVFLALGASRNVLGMSRGRQRQNEAGRGWKPLGSVL